MRRDTGFWWLLIVSFFLIHGIELHSAELPAQATLLEPPQAIDHRVMLREIRTLGHMPASVVRDRALLERMIVLNLRDSVERCGGYRPWYIRAQKLGVQLAAETSPRDQVDRLWLSWLAGNGADVATQLTTRGLQASGAGRALMTLATRNMTWWKPGLKITPLEQVALLLTAKINDSQSLVSQLRPECPSAQAMNWGDMGSGQGGTSLQTMNVWIKTLVETLADPAVTEARSQPVLLAMAQALGVAIPDSATSAILAREMGKAADLTALLDNSGKEAEEGWRRIIEGLTTLDDTAERAEDFITPRTVGLWLQFRLLHFLDRMPALERLLPGDLPLRAEMAKQAPNLFFFRALSDDDAVARSAIAECLAHDEGIVTGLLMSAGWNLGGTSPGKGRALGRQTPIPSSLIEAGLATFTSGTASPLGKALSVDTLGLQGPLHLTIPALSERIDKDPADVRALDQLELRTNVRHLFTFPKDLTPVTWIDPLINSDEKEWDTLKGLIRAVQYEGFLRCDHGDEEIGIDLIEDGYLAIDDASIKCSGGYGDHHEQVPATTAINLRLTTGWHKYLIQAVEKSHVRLVCRASSDQPWVLVPADRFAYGDDKKPGVLARGVAFHSYFDCYVSRQELVGPVWYQRAVTHPWIPDYPRSAALSLIAQGKNDGVLEMIEHALPQRSSVSLYLARCVGACADSTTSEQRVRQSFLEWFKASRGWDASEPVCWYDGSNLFLVILEQIGPLISARHLQRPILDVAETVSSRTPESRTLTGRLALEIGDWDHARKDLAYALEQSNTLLMGMRYKQRHVLLWWLLARTAGEPDIDNRLQKGWRMFGTDGRMESLRQWLSGKCTKAECAHVLEQGGLPGLEEFYQAFHDLTTGSPKTALTGFRAFAKAHPTYAETVTAEALAVWLEGQSPVQLQRLPSAPRLLAESPVSNF